MEDSYSKAKDCALSYLSYRPRTRFEIKRKLYQKGFSEEVVNKVLNFLQEYGFIDDKAFVSMWIQNRMSCKPSGRLRISNELMAKGVARETLEEGLTVLTDEKEYELILELVNKKLQRTPFHYRKFEGFLLRRGFSSYKVHEILSKYREVDSND